MAINRGSLGGGDGTQLSIDVSVQGAQQAARDLNSVGSAFNQAAGQTGSYSTAVDNATRASGSALASHSQNVRSFSDVAQQSWHSLGGAAEQLEINIRPIEGLVGGLSGSFQRGNGPATTFGDHLAKISDIGLGVGTAIASAGVALSFFGEKLEQSRTSLETSFKNSNQNLEEFSGRIDDAIDRLENYGFTADQTNEALAKLVRGTQDPAKAIELLGTAADVATLRHQSLAQAAQQLVLVYGGSNRLLRQFGINAQETGASVKDLKNAQDDARTSLEKYNDKLQDLIDLQQRQAASNAPDPDKIATAADRLEQARQNLSDLQARIADKTTGDTGASVSQQQQLRDANRAIADAQVNDADRVKQANDRIGDAQQRLVDLQQRQAEARAKGQPSSISDAQQLRNAQQDVAQAKDEAARLDKTKDTVDARERLADLQARINDEKKREHTQDGISVSDQQQIRKAKEEIYKAQVDLNKAQQGGVQSAKEQVTQQQQLRKAWLEVVDAQKAKDAADEKAKKATEEQGQNVEKLQQRVKGAAEEHAKTFTGMIDRIRAKVEDYIAGIGATFGKAVTEVGVGIAVLAGLGQIWVTATTELDRYRKHQADLAAESLAVAPELAAPGAAATAGAEAASDATTGGAAKRAEKAVPGAAEQLALPGLGAGLGAEAGETVGEQLALPGLAGAGSAVIGAAEVSPAALPTGAEASAGLLGIGAGPVLAIAAAIAAVVAGLVLLYQHWKPFHDLVDQTWHTLKEALLPAFKEIGGFLKDTFGPIVSFVTDHWKIFAAVLGAMVAGPVLPILAAIAGAFFLLSEHSKGLQQVLEPVANFIGAVLPTAFKIAFTVLLPWIGIPALIAQHWEGVMGVLRPIGNFLKDVFGPVFRVVGDIIEDVFHGVATAAKDVWKFLEPIFNAWVHVLKFELAIAFAIVKDIAHIAWRGVSDAVELAWKIAKPIFGIFKAVVGIELALAFAAFRDIASAAWKALSFVIQWNWDHIFAPVFGFIKKAVGFDLAVAMTVFRDVFLPVWDALKTAVDTAWKFIEPIFNAIKSWVADKFVVAFTFFKDVVVSVFNSIPGALHTALQLAGNVVHGFLNTLGSVAGAVGLDDVAKVLKQAAAEANSWGEGATAAPAPGYAPGTLKPNFGFGPMTFAAGGLVPTGAGFITNRPTAIVGEGGPHDEFVIPTDPKYRQRARMLFQQLGESLYDEMPKMQIGGFLRGALTKAASVASDANKLITAIPGLGDALGDAEGWAGRLAHLGVGVLDKVAPRLDTNDELTSLPASGYNKIRDTVIKWLMMAFDQQRQQGGGGVFGGSGMEIVNSAKKYLGVPYLWGGTDPRVGLDCSGLVLVSMRDLGVGMPRVAVDQMKTGTAVPDLKSAQPGDLVGFGSDYHHIGIYSDQPGRMINAPHTGTQVRYDAINNPAGIRRLAGLVASAGGGPAVAIGQQMAAARGWTGGEWNALYQLWQGESGWNPLADNPTSDAYGIPQSLPGSKMASAGPDWRTNPATQIRWGLDYIAGRYGDPINAYRQWLGRSPHWYSQGGIVADAGAILRPGTSVVQNNTGKAEYALTDANLDAIAGRLAVRLGTAGKGVEINQTFNEKVDPKHMSAELGWMLTH